MVGFGGYASAPAMFAAVQLGIPTVIHEQNAILGRANRLLASRVTRVCTSFDLAKPAPQGRQGHAHRHAGTPCCGRLARRALCAAHCPGGGPFRILVLGGSQGARVFSDVLPAAVRLLPEDLRNRLEITQQCRPEDLDRTCAAYAGTGVHVQLRVVLRQRAGAARGHAFADRAFGRIDRGRSHADRPASVLVPYPYATDDHHSANAQAARGSWAGAWMLKQNAFTPEALAERLKVRRPKRFGHVLVETARRRRGLRHARRGTAVLAEVVTCLKPSCAARTAPAPKRPRPRPAPHVDFERPRPSRWSEERF